MSVSCRYTAVAFWLLMAAGLAGAPKLVVEGTGTVDFGRYPAREQKAAVFILANRGDALWHPNI